MARTDPDRANGALLKFIGLQTAPLQARIEMLEAEVAELQMPKRSWWARLKGISDV